jgi:colanic acid/amylovoran biosynthesis glycosyltransferase
MISVIHSTPIWHPQTQAWQYTNIEPIPKKIEKHIVCERTENLDQFSLPNIHSLSEAPKEFNASLQGKRLSEIYISVLGNE